ncbi:hypothetical protein BJ508DRAFT_419593 [Ascobolus immersus RN42]|uniref:F-box domain-containing protein n=1 Tax=Ascobolus immersus RN42 TaxID=1160509 RepID=A0A3N4HRC2_ASCIM|nr:hypothetical protein BJ508DRAFT_419593 [Ascobolus immersus RN42]
MSGLKILTLPPEIRLCIYEFLPVFSLLQASYSCSLLRTEINKHNRIVASAFGWEDHRLRLLRRSSTRTSHNIARNFTIADVARLQDKDELKLFTSLFGECKTHIGWKMRGIWACVVCLGVFNGHLGDKEPTFTLCSECCMDEYYDDNWNGGCLCCGEADIAFEEYMLEKYGDTAPVSFTAA